MNTSLSTLRKRVEFVADEPGTLLVLLIAAIFILFFPGGPLSHDAAAGHADDAAPAHDAPGHDPVSHG